MTILGRQWDFGATAVSHTLCPFGLHGFRGPVLDLLEPLHVLLLCCPLQSGIHQEPQVAEVLGGEQLGGGRRGRVEEAPSGTSCHCCASATNRIGLLFLRFPQEALGVELHQRLDRPFLARVARSSQNSCRRVSEKAEAQCRNGADDGRALLRRAVGRVAFWGAASAPAGRVDFASPANLAGDGKLCGVLAVLTKQVGEEAATCIDEPVTYLGKEEEIPALT